ncbi:hypothetical protein V5799_006507 [Amblyomma americanum]|uniref:Kinesin motor domain-containing protein n=1 Tax=Amblyomma americanum TaxID=6943 RepID=A0AAQ4DW68_AMBAM
MALDGFASTIMAYGQTGAGKTYTLTGPPVLDLLNPSHKTLPVRWSKDKGFYAENLFVVECEDLGDLDGVLQEGRKNRQVRSHEMNEHSSRSHSILTVCLASEMRDPDDPNTFIRRQGRLSLVDLAGSEKTKKTRSRGNTLVEANNINKSLLVLVAVECRRSWHVSLTLPAQPERRGAAARSGRAPAQLVGHQRHSRPAAPEAVGTPAGGSTGATAHPENRLQQGLTRRYEEK